MNDIKVTIITVAYNCEDTIAKAIESVLSQTYKNIEYLVIDGASKDSTAEIARFLRNSRRLRLNGGSFLPGGVTVLPVPGKAHTPPTAASRLGHGGFLHSVSAAE